VLGSIDPQSPGGETGRIGEIAGRLIAEMDLTSPVSVGQRDLLRQVLQFATDAEHTMMRQAQQLSSLRDSTLIDDMTGVPNKRGLERLFARSVAFSSRYGDTAVLVKVEIRDHEQTLNGLPPLQLSSTLYAVARTVSRLIRSSDVLARIGPREFAILLERCPQASAPDKARAICRELNKIDIETADGRQPLQFGFGLAAISPQATLASALALAERDMLRRSLGPA